MKKKKRSKETILKIPHLNYVVVVRKFKNGDLDNVEGYSKRVSPEEAILCVPLPIKGQVSAGILVHEIVHILQYICEAHNMTFEFEREHMAYIAGYIFKEVCKL